MKGDEVKEDSHQQICTQKEAFASLPFVMKFIAFLSLIGWFILKTLGTKIMPCFLTFFGGTDDSGCMQLGDLRVPFFYNPSYHTFNAHIERGGDHVFVELMKILDDYKNNMNTVIAALVQSWELAQTQEWILFHQNNQSNTEYSKGDHSESKLYSMKLEERINATATVLELDGFVLKKLLQPIEFVNALPYKSETRRESELLVSQSKRDEELESSSYDSAMQITTHIARDWTTLGRAIRKSLYDWCISKLQSHVKSKSPSSVLVPGAGLGRLAFDIASNGYNVEANEISVAMSAAAFQLLQHKVSGEVHPFAFDFLVNEADSNMKFQKVPFPDLERRKWSGKNVNFGSLSYTVGDFVETYSTKARARHFEAVVTCFFIDTATNIYEYLLVIRNSLKFGGSWINVGPLQWHSNAKLHPSADELKIIIESLGFIIISWQVDDTPLNYRDDDRIGKPRYTKYEGYKPLRFVATLPLEGWNEGNTIEQISAMRCHGFPVKNPHDADNRDSSSSVEIEEIQ